MDVTNFTEENAPVRAESKLPSTSSNHQAHIPSYNKAHETRKYCILGLFISGLLSILCLGTSFYVISVQNPAARANPWAFPNSMVVVPLPRMATQLLALLFNFIVALCTETLAYIHTTSLRWALFHERRLKFNSNLRLFTSAQKCASNRWPTNLMSMIFLVMSYAATPQIFTPTLVTSENHDEDVPAMGVNGVALLMLGVGLFGQSLISLWCLIAGRTYILSWSPNPLNTALACLHGRILVRRVGRGMMPAQLSDLASQPTVATAKQEPLRRAYPVARHIVRLLWVVLAVTTAFASIICGLMFVNNQAPYLSFFANVDGDGAVEVPVGGAFWPDSLRFFCLFMFAAAIQCPLVIALHCVELLVNVSRDEGFWRLGATPNGAALDISAAKAVVQSWESVILAITKPFAQWLFGVGVTPSLTTEQRINFRALPLFVLAGTAAAVASFGELLLRRKPKGPQPATYGHLQTIVDGVDDWGDGGNGKLYWGSKGFNLHGQAVVGTSTMIDNIGKVQVGQAYV